VLLAISLVAIMGVAALGIDLGMLLKVRAEAQRAADAAALAGASAFLQDQPRATEEALAVSRAKQLADTNYMAGAKIDTASEVTVTVLWDSSKVRVKVRRAAVPTWFAQVFGWRSVPVGAKAAAVADYATGTKCTKPIAIPDFWDDNDNDTDGNNLPNGTEKWLYTKPPDVYQPANYGNVDGAGTGYGSVLRDATTRDWGMRVVLRPSINSTDPTTPCTGTLQGGKCYIPGWWGLWGETNRIVDMMYSCTTLSTNPGIDTTTWQVATPYDAKTGWTSIAKAIEDIYNLDPGASWGDALPDVESGKVGRVTGSAWGEQNWRASPRVWIMAMVPPDGIPKANEQIRFNNFMLFFFEGCMDNGGSKPFNSPIKCKTDDVVVGRFAGLAKGTATGPSPGTMTRILRLVE